MQLGQLGRRDGELALVIWTVTQLDVELLQMCEACRECRRQYGFIRWASRCRMQVNRCVQTAP